MSQNLFWVMRHDSMLAENATHADSVFHCNAHMLTHTLAMANPYDMS